MDDNNGWRIPLSNNVASCKSCSNSNSNNNNDNTELGGGKGKRGGHRKGRGGQQLHSIKPHKKRRSSHSGFDKNLWKKLKRDKRGRFISRFKKS